MKNKPIKKSMFNGSHFNVMSKAEVNMNCENIVQIIPVAFNEYLVEVYNDDVATKDLVEVVRCKDCMHFSKTKEPTAISGKCDLRCDFIWQDDFCSYGTKKEIK